MKIRSDKKVSQWARQLYIKKNAHFGVIKSCPLELNLNTHAANECRRPY